MKKRILILLTIVLLAVSVASPALAKRPGSGSKPGKQEEPKEEREKTPEEIQEQLEQQATEERRAYLRRSYEPKPKDYDQNTICSFGPQFRKVSPRMTDEWYMFTPVDLSRDGKQTFDLIAGNMYVVGEVTVTVKNGKFQVDYTYCDSHIVIGREFFTFFPDYDSITEKDITQPKKRFDYGRAYDINLKLDGDTDVILFVCNTATFQKTTPGVSFYHENHPDVVPVREEMLNMIGKTEK